MPYLSDALSLIPCGVEVAPGWWQTDLRVDPTPGATTVSRTVDGSVYERIRMARATFTADATAGTRNPRLEFVHPSGAILYATPISTGVALSTSVTINLAIDGPSLLGATGVGVQRLPDNLLPPGYTVRFVADAVGAADAWSGVRFWLVQYATDITNPSPNG